MDHYLQEEHVVERLVGEWKKYKKLIIAVDFDNTVYDYHHEGHSYSHVIGLLKQCHEMGAYIMIYTARDDEELVFVNEYLTKQNIPFDSINEIPSYLPFKGKKLYYNILLDDRAGLSSAYQALCKTILQLKSEGWTP